MHPSLLPSLSDWGALAAYLLGNPQLFIGQTSVMTAEVEILALPLRLLSGRSVGWAQVLLSRVGPTLWVVAWLFLAGSAILSAEIYGRFYSSIPMESEVQLQSGIGHVVFGALMVWTLWPTWQRTGASQRAVARLMAGLYFAVQVRFFEPPWFSFQGQRELVLGLVWQFLVVFIMWAGLDLARYHYPHELQRALRDYEKG